MHQEVEKKLWSVFGQYALWMELNTYDGKIAVAHSHDRPVVEACRDFQTRGKFVG